MKKELGFEFIDIPYSKKISDCVSGVVVTQKSNRFLIVNLPEMVEKERNFFSEVLDELKHSSAKIETKADIYF